MRQYIFITLLMFLCAAQNNAQQRADQQHPADPESFSMILLGDPQGYNKYDFTQPIFELCTAWIADNIENLNIKSVLCTGDLVEQNENIVLRDQPILNQTSREMWEAASKAFSRLDNKVPYIISCGNHDYGYRSANNGMTHFSDYFPFERNNKWRNICVSNYSNRNGRASLENAAFEFKDPAWGNILVITSEFYPRDEVLQWAKELVASDKYKNHRVIFMTHAYMATQKENAKLLEQSYGITSGNSGVQIWEKLLAPSGNIQLLICGHMATNNNVFAENVAYRTDKNRAGKTVHQMMFNVQTLGGGYQGNGGDGWLRILEFMPDGETIKIRTYSPLFGISPSTKHLAYRTEAYDQFDIVMDKPDLSNELMLCGDNKVWIIDKEQSNGKDIKTVWKWENKDAVGQLPPEYQKYLEVMDECKFVDNGKKLLLTASSGGVVLLERETKKCLFYAYAPMAHSADLLPGGKIAVALSTHPKGNSIEIYDINQPEKVLFKDSLYSGHGSVWMESRNRYYALGHDRIREYSLADWNTNAPKLKLERSWIIPGESGHDLVPISGNELLLTENHGVHLFNIDEEKFEPFIYIHNEKGVKSVNYNKESKEFIYTKGEINWWTHNIHFQNPDKTITIPEINMYKVRPNPF